MEDTILAAIVSQANQDKVRGMSSIIVVQNEAEQQRTALLLSRILKAMSHDLENGVTAVLYFVCKRENASHLLFLPPINVIRSHMLIVWSLISRRGSDT